MNYLLIFIGGGIGSMLRYASVKLVESNIPSNFPLGVMLVNISGSFIIGILAGLGFRQHETLHPLLIVGVLGGFTTFSSFSLEATNLLSEGKYAQVLIYVLASVIFSILGTVMGLKLT